MFQKLVGAVVWTNWRSRGEAGGEEGCCGHLGEPALRVTEAASRAALRVGDMGNRVKQLTGAQLESICHHPAGPEPKALRPRIRVALFTRPACRREQQWQKQ